MKLLVTFVFTILMLSIVAKKPVFDSIKTYESASIHFKKKTQGLFDDKNKKYIVPISNVEIYELANGFYGIADPKTRLVQIIFHNEHYTFKTSWQTKQMVLDNSDNFEYAGIFQTNNFTTLQMEDVIIVEDGLGYSINNEKLGNITKRGFAGIYYVSNDLVILTNNKKWNAIDNCNKKHISDVTIFREVKKNIQIFTQQYNEFYADSSNIFIANYQLDSNSITENYSNENEESLTRTYMKYDFNLKDLKKVAFNTDKELNIQHIDSLSSYFKNSEYENISSFFTISRYSELVSNFDKNKASSTLIYDIPNTISVYDLNSEIIALEASNGNKTFIEIDSTRKSQTKNIENSLDVTINYINKDLLLLRWYCDETGQQYGLWNSTSKNWVIEPSNNVVWNFENKIIKEIYSVNNDLNEPELLGYEIYNINGTKIREFNSSPEINEFLNSILTVDSLSVIDQNVFTYKNGKKGYLFLVGIPTVYPIRVFQEEFDQINVNAYQDLFILIKDSTISLSNNFRYYKNGFNTFHLINYDLNAQKIGFSIYRQNYMYGENRIPDIKILQVGKYLHNENFKSDFIWTNHNFGFEKLSNGNLIIQNVKIKEVNMVPIYSEDGDPIDLDEDGMEDYQELINPNLSKSGVYSPQLKKWIIAPNKNWIGEFNGNYLTSEYDDNYEIKYSLFDKTGMYLSSIFENQTNLEDEIKGLYSADSVSHLNNSIYSVITKKDHYIIDLAILNGTIEINQLYKNDYLMYHLNNNFNMENLFLCKNEKGYFYNWKNHQEGMDSIIPINFDHYIMTSARDGNYDYINLGDTLRYHFKEKSTVELIKYLNEEGAYRSKLGKIKLDSVHTLIVNFTETHFYEYYVLDQFDNALIQFNENKGTFASGIYNDKTNKWDLLPKYEKIIPTVYGFTGVIRKDRVTRGDGDVSYSTPPVIVKEYAYDIFDHNFKLIRHFGPENNPYLDPNNFKYLTSNLDFDTIYELKNEHLSETAYIMENFKTAKNYLYFKKGKGYGALTHWYSDNSFLSSPNQFDLINYNPFLNLTVGLKNDSLHINDLPLKLTSDILSISVFESGYNTKEFIINETTIENITSVYSKNAEHKWEKKIIEPMTNYGVIDGAYYPPVAEIRLNKNELLINNLERQIEDYGIEGINADLGYIEPEIYYSKYINDVLWRKVNNQWEEVLNEGTITKNCLGYLLTKPNKSGALFNSNTDENSQQVDSLFKPMTFDKYTNPYKVTAIGEGYYFIDFRMNENGAGKTVCFSPTGKIVSDEFYGYEIENGKIKGTNITYDVYGNEIDFRQEYFEMTE